MKIMPTIFQNKVILRFLLFIAVIVFLLIFSGVNNSINNVIEEAIISIRGNVKPDTNIVLIKITGNDIDRIGPWPIKRSYYALLIKSLTDLNVKKIGLEVFLSSKFTSLAIYDNLLTREISKSGKVVLGSVAGQINLKAGKYFTDSLSLPSPKLINENIQTGHLNYIENNGIFIPVEINGFGRIERAFSFQLSGLSVKTINTSTIRVNFISSWKMFKSFSMLEFFNLLNKKSPKLNSLKNKIVIIGITDPQVASTLNTNFEDDLPGLGLHAFALDNLLNDRPLNFSLIEISKIVFIIVLIILLLIFKNLSDSKIFLFYSISFFFFLIISYLLFGLFYIQLAYSFFIIPILVLFVIDVSFIFFEKERQLKGITDETEILKNLLSKKEAELSHLQKELNVENGSGSEVLLEKIQTLKADINKLKEKDEDEKAADILNENEIRNFQGIVYRSKVMSSIIDLINRTAPEEASILILGESGTGKELVAKAIHQLSKRNKNNFVAVNCGALSDTLLESELFGHVKGAFTGAIADKVGRFEAANNGTIFLDEIAETSENFQVKLLRIIQTGDYEKVGSSKTCHTDVRIIAATNKNIEVAVKEKKFREDLYYRINVIKIELPPLSERKEDIEIIAQHFLLKENDNIRFSRAALDALNNYQWKGNVRELEGVIKRAVIFAKSSQRKLIQLADLPEEIVKEFKFNFEDLVVKSLRDKYFSHSSINETAKELNVNRTSVSENLRGYAFKIFVENNFNLRRTSEIIVGTANEEVITRVNNKLHIFLNNIEKDLMNFPNNNLAEVKLKLNSKYKNLPQKYHFYLDEIIKYFLNDLSS